MNDLTLITKEDAKLIKQKWYFTGVPCKNNHLDKRYVNTGICYSCKRDNNKKCNNRHPETLREITKRSYINNREKKLNYNKNWAQKNRIRSNEIKSNWKKNHREEYLIQARNYSKNRRKDPYYKLSKNMSKAIWECLKKNKKQLSWIKFVDYTLNDLVNHLENKFTNEMTWNNYGNFWHVDHIKPLSWFNLKTEFKEAWTLSNLQPLEATKNLSKNNRYIG